MKKFILFLTISVITTKAENHNFKQEQQPFNFLTTDSLLNHISKIESGGDPEVVNKYGCVGKYQFTLTTLKDLGLKEKQINKIRSSFKVSGGKRLFNKKHLSEHLQDSLMERYLLKVRNHYLKHSINKYEGKVVNGIKITTSGVLYASTLGYLHVYNYLSSGGRKNHQDGNGTSVEDRLKQFQQFSNSELD